MGVTDSRAIMNRIEGQYKSLRKYCDPVYGEMTVIQHKTSKRLYALIEKAYLKSNSALPVFLKQNKHENYLLRPENFDVCDISLCSDIRLYFFLFNFTPNNLEQEITHRMQQDRPFRLEDALNILIQQVEIIMLLRQKINPQTSRPNRIVIANTYFLCSPTLEIQVLQPVFKNQPEGLQDSERIYLSPEACKVAQNGETFRVKQISNRQSSLVFTLGLNFMELLLLADVSLIYNQNQEIDFQKLVLALAQIKQLYGDFCNNLLQKMLHQQETMRPSLLQIKRMLKNQRKNRRSMIRFQKEHSTQIY